MPRELPQFNTFPHSNGNMFFLPKEKEARKSKRELSTFAWKYFFSTKRERSKEIKRELFV
jgi:hypothetical protein